MQRPRSQHLLLQTGFKNKSHLPYNFISEKQDAFILALGRKYEELEPSSVELSK